MTISVTATQRSKYLAILRQAINASRNLINSVNVVPGTSRQKRLALLVFHDLAQKCDAIHTLCANGNAVGPEIIGRSAFENFVDLTNIYRHPDLYVDYLLYVSADQQRRALQAILNTPESPYSRSIIDAAPTELGLTVQQMLDATKSELQDHKALLTTQYRRPNKKIPVKQRNVETSTRHRSRMAGMLHEYDSLYRLYSRPAHGDIGSMLGSFISGNNFVWPPLDVPPSTLPVDLALRMLIDSGKLLARKLRRPNVRFRDVEKKRNDWAAQVYGQ